MPVIVSCILGAVQGSVVDVKLKNGTVYEGIFHCAVPVPGAKGLSVALKFAKLKVSRASLISCAPASCR